MDMMPPDAPKRYAPAGPSGRAAPIRRGRSAVAFVLAFLLMGAAQASLVLASNVIIDPRSEFGTGLVTPLVDNYVQRKVELFDAHPDAQVLVLGSSRSATIDPRDVEQVAGLPAFNFAIPSTFPLDALAISRYVAQREAPEVILLGIEQVHLHAGVPMIHNDTADHPRLGPQVGLGGPEPFLARASAIGRTFELAYVKDSLRAANIALRGGPERALVVDANGTLHYAVREAAIAEGADTSGWIEAGIADSLPYYEKVGPLHASKAKAIEKLVQENRARNTTVHVFFTPVHPALIEAAKGTRFEREKEATLDKLAQLCSEGVHLHDYTQVASFGGDERGFYDAWHYDHANGRRLVEALFAGVGDICVRDERVE